MDDCIHIPRSLPSAAKALRTAFAAKLGELPKQEFIKAWASLAYLFPNLHPDGFEDVESGWPRLLRPFAQEAWRRSESGEISDNELYQSDAQWCGIFDRMFIHEPGETQRRVELAAAFGELPNA